MGRSIKKVTPKQRGRPATGKDPLVSTRMPKALIGDVDTWADQTGVKRSEAVRRLVEIGLSARKTSSPSERLAAVRAQELASRTIDHLAGIERGGEADKGKRKSRLIKGPEEFQDVRRDRPKVEK